MCSIMRTSFKVALTGTAGRNFHRFGIGIYASATSSKSDDYAKNTAQSKYKAMFLTTVIVGNGKKRTNDKKDYTCAPPGFDSILGETGDSLNFDEVVVYEDDAIRPSWLVIYEP